MYSVRTVYVSLLVILASRRISSTPIALCSCEEGQYCSEGDCKPCQPGTYRPDPVHDYIWCIPWSTRPDDSHYIIKKNGSVTRDIVWACEKGYEEVEFSTNQLKCEKMKVDSETTAETSVATTTSPKPKDTTLVPNEEDDTTTGGLSDWQIACISIGLIVFVVIVIVILWYCRHRIKSYPKCCFHNSAGSASDIVNKTQVVYGDPDARTPMIDAESGDNGHFSVKPLDTQSEKMLTENGNAIKNGLIDTVPTTKHRELNFSYFYSLVNKLGKEVYAFICHLNNDNGSFEAKSTIEFKKEEHNDSVTAYIEACLAWIQKTPKLNHKECVENALEAIGRQDLIDYQATNKKYSYNGVVAGDQNSGGDSIASKKPDNVRSKAQADSKLYKLFYYLVDFIEVAKSEELLNLLPNENQFNVRNSIELLKKEHKGEKMSHVETLKSWKERNPQIKKLKDIILPLLIEIKRNDAAEDEKLLALLNEHDNCYFPSD